MDAEDKKMDLERTLREANLAFRTGRSAYENENYQLAEPLLIKALDAFELSKATDSHDYFSCLHSLADTYFHLGRYYEAMAYYERLSVGRLQNYGSSDAQIVVSLLKLAATQEKLEDYSTALATYDLIFELAQNTVPRGHALMSVVLESMEVFVKKYVLDEDERESRLEIIANQKRESGFSLSAEEEWTGTLSGTYTGLPGFSSSDSNLALSKDKLANASLLAQEPEQLQKSLKAWTNPDLEIWSLSQKLAAKTREAEAEAPLVETAEEPLKETSNEALEETTYQPEEKPSEVKVQEVKVQEVKVQELKAQPLKPKELKLQEARPQPLKPKEIRLPEAKPQPPKAKPLDVRPRELKPLDVRPRELKPQEISYQDIKPRDLKPQEISYQDIKPKELKAQEISYQDIRPRELEPQENKYLDLQPPEVGIEEAIQTGFPVEEISPEEIQPLVALVAEEAEEAPPAPPAIEVIYAPTAPDEFKGRSTSSHLKQVSGTESGEHAHPSSRLRNYDSDDVAEKRQIQLEHKAAPKANLRNQTNQERYNPKPLITGLVIAGIIGGSILWAQEYAKTTVATNTGIRNTGGIDLSGQNFSTADGKKKLRFISGTVCEAYASGQSVTAEYKDISLKGSSLVTKLMNSSKKVFVVKKVGTSLVFPDGTIFYAEGSDGQKIVTKMQAMAMAAQTYYAGHNHTYPDSAEDFADPIVNFSYRNPLTGSRNKPVITVVNHSAESFDQSFTDQLREMRDKKNKFAQDETEHPPIALIECVSLQPAASLEAERAGSGFLIRAYDPNGKLLTSAIPEKAFVIALKNGVAVDPSKATQETGQASIEFPTDLVLEIQDQPEN